jgi:hypothetical protein
VRHPHARRPSGIAVRSGCCSQHRIEIQVPVALQALHQHRQQGLQALASEPVAAPPQGHHGPLHLGTVHTAAVLLHLMHLTGPLRCSTRGRRSIQAPQQRFSVVTSDHHQLVNQGFFPAGLRPLQDWRAAPLLWRPFCAAAAGRPHQLCASPKIGEKSGEDGQQLRRINSLSVNHLHDAMGTQFSVSLEVFDAA